MKAVTSSNIYRQIINNFGVFFIYLLVNSLFITKYGGHYNVVLLAGYVFLMLGLGILYIKINLNDIFYKAVFWAGTVLFFIFSIYLNYKVDGNSLNVDRWSAMETGIKAILDGQYPYNLPDHMGQESSNLPVLIILGIPFYLLFGSVGYLQSFSFLLFTYLIFKIFKDYRQRLAVLLLLFLSPGYLWEVYVKSDLFSNFIIVSGFTYLIWNKFLVKNSIKPGLVSFLTVLIVLTRLSAIIPLTLLLFRKFYDFSLKEKVRFTVVFILTGSCIAYVFFHNAPDFNVFIEHNPFVIQGAKQPLVLSLSYIILSFILSFRVKSFYQIMCWGGMMLFVCVFIPFVLFFIEYGYTNMITNSFFDLSFFNMAMPFIMIAAVLGTFKNKYKQD